MSDLISREDALVQMDELCRGISCLECPFCISTCFGGCKVFEFIKSLPTIETKSSAMKYKPVCKYGTRHCIHDPAYIKYRQSLFGRLPNDDDSEELMQSDWCAECDNRDECDDEDK